VAERYRRSWLSIAVETLCLVTGWLAVFYLIPGVRHWGNAHGVLLTAGWVLFLIIEAIVTSRVLKNRWRKRHG